MELSEKELVKNAKNDPEAFGVLFDRYYSSIYIYVLKRTAHVQAAQDVTSEVFFKAYKKLWQFTWQGNPFSSWLYRIASNEVNRYFKNGKRILVPVAFMEEFEKLSVNPNSPEILLISEQDSHVHGEDLIRVHTAVQELPVKYQEVLALRYFEEKSILEICEILGKKEGTVKSLLSRGMVLLEKQMQPKQRTGVIQTDTIIKNPRHEQAGH